MAGTALTIITIVTVGRGKCLCLAVKRYVYAACAFVLLIASLAIVIPTHSNLVARIDELRYRWHRMQDPNILNNYVRLENHNESISVPTSHHGQTFTHPIATDLHVEIDHRGYLSINNICFTKILLERVLVGRVKRIKPYRVFIWADAKASPDSIMEVSRLIQESGCSDLYFVVSSPRLSDGKIEYKAVSIEESLIITNAWSANTNRYHHIPKVQ